MLGANAAANALYNWLAVRLWNAINITNFTVSLLLPAVFGLLRRCLQHSAAADAAAVPASAAIRASVAGMSCSTDFENCPQLFYAVSGK